jgi:uncharacterized protein
VVQAAEEEGVVDVEVAEIKGIKRMFSDLPVLGVGIGFREPFRGDLFLHRPSVDFLEITVEHYLDSSPHKEEELTLLADHFTIIPHAINLSLGSGEGVNKKYLEKLAKLIDSLNPPWWSEHISYTHAGGIDIGHLSPMPFSYEAIEIIHRNIEEVRQYIKAPLILENISYMLTLPGQELTEGEFITKILEYTNCGLLLDVTNLYTNAVNHHYDIDQFLNSLPLDRVVQLHFVGGQWYGDILIDSHSQATPIEVWTVMDKVLSSAAVKGIILERDENIPPFIELVKELDHARSIGKRYGRWD